jgi:hypothetical protein
VRNVSLNEQFKFVGYKSEGNDTDWWGKKGKNSGGRDNFESVVAGVYDVIFDEDIPTQPKFILVKAFEGTRR